MSDRTFRSHASHWGTFRARWRHGELEVKPFEDDPAPSEILQNIPAAVTHPARLQRPLVRRGWLEQGPGPDERRGQDDYIEVEWPEALDLVATELRRLGAGERVSTEDALPGAHVFGGSYGWSSAGRFHHAQSQVHRFLNVAFGGYVSSVDTYSSAAGAVVLDLVWGNAGKMCRDGAQWREIADDTELMIAFGGLPVRNMANAPGGISRHDIRQAIQAADERGCEFVSVSPLADDIDELTTVSRVSIRPSSDVAFMLGMAWHLHDLGRVDHRYLARYTQGYEVFEAYLLGRTDGVPKTPEWAGQLCGVSSERIRRMAERASRKRTHITISYALQRSRYGEEPVWMALTLAAMLGHYDRPGGGFSYALGSMGNYGKPLLDVPLPTLPQGRNRVADFIPVARIAELLQYPGRAYTYKGETRHYADIRLVYWAGGNPFHHHQDLSNLTRAFACPDTVIVHESVGTATARHADIVLPATVTAERDDMGGNSNDPYLVPMSRLVDPPEGARDDYDIFADLARRLGCQEAFTQGLSSREWLVRLYEPTRQALAARGMNAPDFATFMEGEPLPLPLSTSPSRMQRFHLDPDRWPLETPSGRIELASETVARSGLPAHPAWLEPEEWLGSARAEAYPFQLVANQPRGRLHSQLDFGAYSMAQKQSGREVARLNVQDARRLGIATGDVVLLTSPRGGALAAALLSDQVAPCVIQLSTGAWYAPVEVEGVGRVCVNGNPNALTSDIGASPLSQGCAGQLSLVAVRKWAGPVPNVVAHEALVPVGRR